MTKSQQAVLNTKEAMAIITSEAKQAVANKFKTTIEVVEMAIFAKNENVLSMMRQFVVAGVNEVAAH